MPKNYEYNGNVKLALWPIDQVYLVILCIMVSDGLCDDVFFPGQFFNAALVVNEITFYIHPTV